jgi:predicted ester cyclase
MRNQWLFRSMVTLALLLCLSLAACQPITAPVAIAQSPRDAAEVNKAAMRGWAEAFNAHDLNGLDQAVDRYYATDYVLHDPTVPNFSGGSATVKQLVRESLTDMPDLHLTIENLIAEGDMLAIRGSVSGTDPSGKPISFWAMSVIRFTDGQLAEEWELVAAPGEEVVGSDIGSK